MAIRTRSPKAFALAATRPPEGWAGQLWKGGPLFIRIKRGGLYKPRHGNSHNRPKRFHGPVRKSA